MKINEEWITRRQAEKLNPDRYSFEWNADYTMARATALRWHDDGSYIAFQSNDPENDGDE